MTFMLPLALSLWEVYFHHWKKKKNCPLFHLPHPTVQELCLSLAKHFTKPTKERVGTLEVESGTDLDALNLLEEGYQEKGSERSRQGRGRA